jgi:hypothetical protein
MNTTRRIHLNPQSKGNLGKSFEAEFRTAWLDKLGVLWNGSDLDDRHHTLLQRYFYRLVSDTVRTLKAQEIAWDADLIAGSGAATLNDLEYPGALKMLQMPALVTKLAGGFPDNPVGAMRIERLAATLQDPKKTADTLLLHQKHLLWQLGRLYRIRCCIVHGSVVRFKLPLFTANMEFYLKELIIVCLRSLSGGDEQNLKLVFTTHEISVRGHHLRRIETVMQRMELSLLTKLPSSQRSLITEGQPLILEIVVKEIEGVKNEKP